MSRVHTKDDRGRRRLASRFPTLADLAAGEVGGFLVAGVPILACRVGDDLFAYHDRCGSCEDSMAGAALHRPMGSPVGEAVLRCPRCHAHFDAVHAGAGSTRTPTRLRISTRSRCCCATACCRSRSLAEATGVM